MTEFGFIVLHRKIKDSAIYSDSQAVHLWLHLLIKANHKDKDFVLNGQLVTVKRGQTLTGRRRLSVETGIAESKIQRLLKLFENLHMIEQQTNSKNRLISITNYHSYQSGEQQTNSKRTASEQQVNTNNNDNNDNKLFTSSDDDLYEKPVVEKIPYQQIIDLYHKHCPDMPKVIKLTDKRKRQIKARWNDQEYNFNNLQFWDEFFKDAGESDTLNGRKAGFDFKADIEFLTRAEKFVNVLEGKYKN